MNFLYLPQKLVFDNEIPVYMQQYYRYCGAMNGGKQNHMIELLPQKVKDEIDFSEYFFEFNDREIVFDTIIGGYDSDEIDVWFIDDIEN